MFRIIIKRYGHSDMFLIKSTWRSVADVPQTVFGSVRIKSAYVTDVPNEHGNGLYLSGTEMRERCLKEF